jgi:hypothetical protein
MYIQMVVERGPLYDALVLREPQHTQVASISGPNSSKSYPFHKGFWSRDSCSLTKESNLKIYKKALIN